MHRTLRLGLVGALAVLAVAVAPTAAAASPAAGPAYLRLAHLSPDTPAVDVYVSAVGDPASSFTVPGVVYGSVSEYRPLPATSYIVRMRATGAPADSPPAIATTLVAQPGAAYTLAGAGHYSELGLTVLDDDLAAPPAGQARIRVINAAATAPKIDLGVAGGSTIATDVGFGEATGYRSVQAGPWAVRVVAPGGGGTTLPIRVNPATAYTVLLLDRQGRFAAELHTDGVGSQSTPSGGVETGYGATVRPSPALALLLFVAAVGAAALIALGLRRRSARARSVVTTAQHRTPGRHRRVRPNAGELHRILGSAGLVSVVLAAAVLAPGPGRDAEAGPDRFPGTSQLQLTAVSAALVRPRVVPVAVRIPRLGVSSDLVPLDVDGRGALLPPPDPETAGWYVGSVVPGNPGPAVIAGHVDSDAGPGVFFALDTLRPGDEVQVVRSDGRTVTFRVLATGTFDKNEFPTGDVYGPTPVAELSLITCGGRFDLRTHRYLSNVVVHAGLS